MMLRLSPVVAATPPTQCDSRQHQEGSSNSVEEVSKVDAEASHGLLHHCSGDEENDEEMLPGSTGLDDDLDSGHGILGASS